MVGMGPCVGDIFPEISQYKSPSGPLRWATRDQKVLFVSTEVPQRVSWASAGIGPKPSQAEAKHEHDYWSKCNRKIITVTQSTTRVALMGGNPAYQCYEASMNTTTGQHVTEK